MKELPRICFDGLYEGGKEAAMRKRRKLRDEDPERQEKRRLRRIEELKSRMAELQRKKEEKATKQSNKRKIEEAELEDEAAQLVKQEDEETGSAPKKPDEEVEKTEEDEPAEETEETNLLESALDHVQDDTGLEAKTREEAEADRRNLLAGEIFDQQEYDEGAESDEDDYGYTGDRGRHSLVMKQGKDQKQLKDKRMLPLSEQEAEVLRKLGYSIVSDDESKVIGANMIPPWQSSSDTQNQADEAPPRMRIKFRTNFDMAQLDVMGRVIDQGDENFTPSRSWIGRKAGFEFKLGERGLGYYRTGVKVVVPSNTAY